jgi:hypothetical protein
MSFQDYLNNTVLNLVSSSANETSESPALYSVPCPTSLILLCTSHLDRIHLPTVPKHARDPSSTGKRKEAEERKMSLEKIVKFYFGHEVIGKCEKQEEVVSTEGGFSEWRSFKRMRSEKLYYSDRSSQRTIPADPPVTQ